MEHRPTGKANPNTPSNQAALCLYGKDLMENKYTIVEGSIGDCLIIEDEVQDMWERLARLADATSEPWIARD